MTTVTSTVDGGGVHYGGAPIEVTITATYLPWPPRGDGEPVDYSVVTDYLSRAMPVLVSANGGCATLTALSINARERLG